LRRGAISECKIGFPFDCKVWSFSSEADEIIIQVTNIDSEDYFISSFLVEGCRVYGDSAGRLDSSSAKSFVVLCPLDVGEVFIGNVVIRYKIESGGLAEISEGVFIQEVR